MDILEKLPYIFFVVIGFWHYFLGIFNWDFYFKSALGKYWLNKIDRQELRILYILAGLMFVWYGLIHILQ